MFAPDLQPIEGVPPRARNAPAVDHPLTIVEQSRPDRRPRTFAMQRAQRLGVAVAGVSVFFLPVLFVSLPGPVLNQVFGQVARWRWR